VEQCDELLKSSGALDAEAKGKMTDINDLWQTVKKWGDVFSQPRAGATAPTAKPTPQQPSAPLVQPPERETVQRPQPAPQQQAEPQMPVPQTHPQPSQPPMPAVVPAQFIPFGQWQVQVNDVYRSIVYLDLIPNGVCFGSQFGQGIGHIQFRGRWGYNPHSRLLQVQGLINGVQPFMINIIIHGTRGDGTFYGVGSDGYAYLLSPYKLQ
jgi:hypothetical protein